MASESRRLYGIAFRLAPGCLSNQSLRCRTVTQVLQEQAVHEQAVNEQAVHIQAVHIQAVYIQAVYKQAVYKQPE